MALNWQDLSDATQRITGINDSTKKLEGATAAGALLGGVLFGKAGTSSGTGAQQTIAHGLGVTPDFVLITPTAACADVPSVAASDGSYIYPTVTNGVAYSWLAVVVG